MTHASNHAPHAGLAELLPGYAANTLGADETLRVQRHLAGCAACRAQLDEWRAVARATREIEAAAPAPSPTVLRSVFAALDREQRATARLPPRRKLALLWQLLAGQLPLVRRGIWLASALTMALGWLVAFGTAARPGGDGLALALVAPIIAAVGVAFVYGPENDPSLEVALSTPTSPRLVLLARLTLVYAYDAALALAATALLALLRPQVSLLPLLWLWLGPMLFLSALSLAASLYCGPMPAMLGALLLWASRLLVAGTPPRHLMRQGTFNALHAFWQAGPLLAVVGLALLLVVLLGMPHRPRLAGT